MSKREIDTLLTDSNCSQKGVKSRNTLDVVVVDPSNNIMSKVLSVYLIFYVYRTKNWLTGPLRINWIVNFGTRRLNNVYKRVKVIKEFLSRWWKCIGPRKGSQCPKGVTPFRGTTWYLERRINGPDLRLQSFLMKLPMLITSWTDPIPWVNKRVCNQIYNQLPS